MRILVVSQYFWPESFIINDLVKELDVQGHSIQVLTGKPNYPEGEIFQGYTAEGCDTESFTDTVPIYRVPIRARKNGGGKNLFLNYLSFAVSGLFYFPKAVKGQVFDVVLVFVPSPITAVIPGIYLKWRLRAHLAVWVQDLWPESIQATGFVQNKTLLKMTGWMVRAIYACADSLLVQSRAFYAPVARYACLEKIVYYPNSNQDSFIDNKNTRGINNENIPTRLTDVLSRYFCLTFAGNLGTAQSLETLLSVAERLRYLAEIRIVLVGSGSMSEWLAKQKIERELNNVILAGRYPPSAMPKIFNQSQALLVTLKKDEVFSYTIPSKVQAYLAAGRPIIAAFDGEGARVVNEAGAGLTCSAEDVEGLVNCIETFFQLPESERDSLGIAGREYYLQHFEMKRQCKRLVEILENRMRKEKVG